MSVWRIILLTGVLAGAHSSLSSIYADEGRTSAASPTIGRQYNGIILPKVWPPRQAQLPRDPEPPPYLVSPPRVIPIDVGRQLFVDDFLIETSSLKRTYHRATYYERNPVLSPDRPWETATAPNPCAMVFSDGVWYDPADQLFKMWYMAGYDAGTAYATSANGIHWHKPILDVVPKTNLVQQGRRDSSTVWLDLSPASPHDRFKMGYYTNRQLFLSSSVDGVHWSEPERKPWAGDRSTFFYNPFRRCWVFSLRADAAGYGRIRRYWEMTEFSRNKDWRPDGATLWIGADRADEKRNDLRTQPELYNLDCVAYESVLLGLFSIWRGQPRDRPKPNEICVGFSRDGFHWHRPDRHAFVPVSERFGDWNWGNVQSAGGCCLVMGDKLYFYVSGRAGVRGTRNSGVCSTGLALLRRDGFASLDADERDGSITTRPIRFTGPQLFVNADTHGGELTVEILDEQGRAIEPFTRKGCIPVRTDSTRVRVAWKGAPDLSALVNRTARFRFWLRNGQLFAFWVSRDLSGASHGYLAAGGPGLSTAIDIQGAANNTSAQ
jgi:hypothetical protein